MFCIISSYSYGPNEGFPPQVYSVDNIHSSTVYFLREENKHKSLGCAHVVCVYVVAEFYQLVGSIGIQLISSCCRERSQKTGKNRNNTWKYTKYFFNNNKKKIQSKTKKKEISIYLFKFNTDPRLTKHQYSSNVYGINLLQKCVLHKI